MKKIILLLCFSLMLTACAANTNSDSDTQQKSAESAETAEATEIITAPATEAAAPTEPTTEPPTEAVTPETWQEAYRLEIEKAAHTIENPQRACFSVNDLNNDGTPELIISEGMSRSDKCSIYTFNDNIISLGQHGFFGVIGYCKEKNIVMSGFSGEGETYSLYFSVKNDSIEHIAKLYDNSGTSQPIEYKIDDKPVTENEYNSAASEYKELEFKSFGRDFPLSAEIFDSVTTAFTDWKNAYSSLLESWSIPDTTDSDSELYQELHKQYFSVCDINVDDTPELIISEGTYHFAKCYVYSFDNSDNTLTLIGKLGSYGNIGYNPDINMIKTYDMSQGYEFSSYYTIDENHQLQHEINFFNDRGRIKEDEECEYKINGNLVSYEEYQDTLECYKSDNTKWLGLEYGLDEVKYVLNEAINENTDWKGAYTQLLYSLKDTEQKGKYSLCDINGSGTPELIVHTSNKFYIYGFNNDNELMFAGRIDTETSAGFMSYATDINMISTFEILEEGNKYITFYTIDENYKIKRDVTLYNNLGVEVHPELHEPQEWEEFEIDGQKVSWEEFQKKREEYKSECVSYLGTDFRISDSGIKEGLK